MFWNVVIFFAIAVYLAILILGFAVYRINPSKQSNQLFFLFSITFTVWLISNFLEIWLPGEGPATLFLNVDFFLAPFLCMFLFMFLLSFPNERFSFSIKNSITILLSIPAIVAAALVSLGLLISDVTKMGYEIGFSEQPLFALYGLVIAFYVFGGIGYAIFNHVKQEGIKKSQTRAVLLGLAGTFFILFVGNIFLQNLIGAKAFLLVNLSSILLPVCIAYAILNHRFMGLKTIYRMFVYSIGLFAVMAIYTAVAATGSQVFAEALAISPTGPYALFSILFVPIFIFVQKQLQDLTSRVFTNKIRFEKIFQEILTGMDQHNGRSDKLHTLIEKTELVMGIKPTILLYGQDQNTCEYHGHALPDLNQAAIDHLCQKSHMVRKTIIRDEYKFRSYIPGGEKEHLHKILKDEKIQVMIPIIEEQKNDTELRGAIILADKVISNYSKDEINFLEMLAPQLPAYLK